jgi:hypothetical protein
MYVCIEQAGLHESEASEAQPKSWYGRPCLTAMSEDYEDRQAGSGGRVEGKEQSPRFWPVQVPFSSKPAGALGTICVVDLCTFDKLSLSLTYQKSPRGWPPRFTLPMVPC